MSSTLRYFNQIKPLTKMESLSTPSYTDNTILGGTTVPIPFSYQNGVLDINIQGSNVQADLIGTGPILPTPAPMPNPPQLPVQPGSMDYKAKEMGGTGKVFSLGPKMIEWLSNIVTRQLGPYVGTGATFIKAEVQEGGYVTKAQLTLDESSISSNFAGATNTFAFSSGKPTGDQYVYGTVANNYYTTWIFKNPVVIKIYTSTGITYYSLYSNWTQA